MSSYSFYFLFDYSSFAAKIIPVLDALIKGSSRELEQVAIVLVKDNPEIWHFVGYSRVPLYDDDSEKGIDDVINAGVLPWLLLVISNYCSELARHHVDYRILKQAGIDEKTLNMLTDPKPLGDMLIKIASKIVPTDYIDRSFNTDFNINHCPVGWLGIDDIEKIVAAVKTNIEQTETSTSAHDSLLIILDKAITSKRALILGHWFN